MRLSRRSFSVGVLAALAGSRARADAKDGALELRTFHVETTAEGTRGSSSRASEREVLVALPRAKRTAVPLVVLLHGLGETRDPETGARAWVDLYGLNDAVDRLAHAPLARVSSRDDWGPELGRANADLAAHPYAGLAFACPYLPRMASGELDAYARWVSDVVVPRVRAEAGPRLDASLPRLGGCSYGGWASLEIFLRAPERFSAWAGVQTAIGRDAVLGYASRIARIDPRPPLLLETSTFDPFHDANVALARELHARGIACDLRVLPGPHDQPWLRESGTASLLLWLDQLFG
jgi:pimeloyl-ACP methyl ester carboxylesterase